MLNFFIKFGLNPPVYIYLIRDTREIPLENSALSFPLHIFALTSVFLYGKRLYLYDGK